MIDKSIPAKKYRHLLKHERIIWERYLKQYPDRFRDVEYDVKVGGDDTNYQYRDPFLGVAWNCYVSKRIDVVGHSDGCVTLIEVKSNAGLHAIGQLLCYAELWKEKWKTLDRVAMMLVTDFAQADMEFLCEKFGIVLIEAK